MATNIVILGGGMVAGYAARELVEAGIKPGELTIVSADSALPYERPALSKAFLAGKQTEQEIHVSPGDFYREHGIDVQLRSEVVRVDRAGRRLWLGAGGSVGFDKLVLATGSRVRKLRVPGASLTGIEYLRSLNDAKAIRAYAEDAKQAVVIGGGFIGMEVASVLAGRGIATTMVLGEDRVWKHFFSPELSRFFEAYYEARGVRLVKSAQVAEFRGESAVSSAVLAGGETISCDVVVAGIGVEPVVEPLAESGIRTDNGVVVNEYLETEHAGIYAAGDIANYPDALFGKRRRVEHWDNAVAQGQHCARALMGRRVPFEHVPYFFSDVFDLSYEFWGDTAGTEQVIYRGDLAGNSFSAWWLRGQTVTAAFAMSRPEEERDAAVRWIQGRQRVSPERLADSSRSILDAAEALRSGAR